LANTTFTQEENLHDATFEVVAGGARPKDLRLLDATFDLNNADERLSEASDASSNQRLDSVNDVQSVAKMQEESEADFTY